MRITRRAILEEALEIFSSRQRCFSRNLSKLEPKEGYEIAWDAEQEKCDMIREWMRELMAGGVKDVSDGTGEGRETMSVLRSGAGDDSGDAVSGSEMGSTDHETVGYLQGSMFGHELSGALYGAPLFPDEGGRDGELEQEDIEDDSELCQFQGDRDRNLRPWQLDIMDGNGDLHGGSGSGSAGDAAESGYGQMQQDQREHPFRF